jgi:hypothetical protein
VSLGPAIAEFKSLRQPERLTDIREDLIEIKRGRLTRSDVLRIGGSQEFDSKKPKGTR